MALKTFWQCDTDNIAILTLLNPKHVPYELRLQFAFGFLKINVFSISTTLAERSKVKMTFFGRNSTALDS